MRGLVLFLMLLVGQALAHSEPVEITASLTRTANLFTVDATLVGQTSGLPVRGATLALEVSPAQGEGASGVVKGTFLSRGEGRYTAAFPVVLPGRYILTWIDTTYRGEAAVVARPWSFSGQSGPLPVAILPSTSTPPQYLTYALIGLLVPLVGFGAFWGAGRLWQRPSRSR